jgi:hypothetical protein
MYNSTIMSEYYVDGVEPNREGRTSSLDSLDTISTTGSVATTATLTKKYLFRSAVDIRPLVAVLTRVAPTLDGGKWYQFDISSFHKMVFHGIHDDFVASIRGYYFPAKWKKYGDKSLTYNSFTTIMRQLCNEVGRTFYTKHVYDHSVCNTVYFISAICSDFDQTGGCSLGDYSSSLII